MKTLVQNIANCRVLTILLIALAWGAGCTTTKPTLDPLAGFQFSSLNNLNSNLVITEDYKNYILSFSTKERNSHGPILFFEDGHGLCAIKFETGKNGTSWSHVLIYDKEGKRIKTIKYVSGHYRS